jgi:hypothetical protein
MDKLLAALKRNRHGHRDWLIALVIYRHGLRVSEACDLRWDDIDLPKRTMIVRRLKGSTDSVHYLERDEVNGLKLLQRQQQAGGIKGAYVFINERGQPFARMGIGRLIERAGEAAGLVVEPARSFSAAVCVARCWFFSRYHRQQGGPRGVGIHPPCEGWGYFTDARKGKNGVFRHGKHHYLDAAPPCFQKSAINLVNDDMTSGDPLRHP